MNETKEKFSFIDWIKENKFYLLAFFLPVVSMLVVFAFKGCAPFGDEVYVRSDCYHQYTPFLQVLQEKLRNFDNISYTWKIGGGMNYAALVAYYSASPLNLITIIWPFSMAHITEFFIVMKMGLCGFSMTYFLTKRYGKKGILPVAFGMGYALSAYLAAYSWDIMWLDCLWIFPFIMLGLERLVRERKCFMYAIALGYGILTNYYIGVILCLFSILYFIYLFIVTDVTPKLRRTEKHYMRKMTDEKLTPVKTRLLIIKDYAVYSIIAGGISAAFLLPAFLNMALTKSAESEFPDSLSQYFSTMYMLFRSMISIPVADLKYAHDPNIYCSVALFMLIPLYWLCKKIKAKERIGKTVLMAVMLFSFSFNIPDYIWHGLHFPSSLPCRQSFTYIFLVLTMGYEALLHIKEIKAKYVGICAGFAIGLFFIFEQFFDTTKLDIFTDVSIQVNMYSIVWLSVVFLAIYAILIGLYKSKPELKGFFAYIMILVVFCELTLNMQITSIQSTVSNSGYYASYDAMDQLNKIGEEQASNEGVKFYRTERKGNETRNDGARYNYRSISTFSSVAIAGMQDLYSALGMQTSFNAYEYNGHTPLTAAMFSVKYEYASDEASCPDQMQQLDKYSYKAKQAGAPNGTAINIYEYKNTLPLGFVINPSTVASWDLDNTSPFEVQNSFVRNAVSGGQDVFHKLKDSGEIGKFVATYVNKDDAPSTGEVDAYVYCTTSSQSLTVTVSGNTDKTLTFNSTDQNYICHIGNVKPGSKIEVTAGDDKGMTACEAYAWDNAAWEADFEALNAQGLKVTNFEETDITGEVDVKTDGMMFTSLPYDNGWSVYVDGEKVKTEKIAKNALTGFNIGAGKHKVEFKYAAPGFLPGCLISFFFVLVMVALFNIDRISAFIHRKKKGNKQ